MATEAPLAPKPGHPAIRIGQDGSCHIAGYRCGDCGGVFAEEMLACRRCGSRAAPQEFEATNRGKLYSWSVVHRSYPGIEVPFVSVIVDLDDGLTLKGTLRGVEHDTLKQGMPVRLVFDDAGGAIDKDGNPYVGFHFVPGGQDQ